MFFMHAVNLNKIFISIFWGDYVCDCVNNQQLKSDQ